MTQDTPYNEAFYSGMIEGSKRSSRAVLPKLFNYYRPKSMIDVGCGVGCWLQAATEMGVENVLGIDGEYISDESLLIPKEFFQSKDLESLIDIREVFDLVNCLEVIEHLSEARGESLVDELCRLGRVILFSCAIPAQEGTNHINEQFPSYWIPKFAKNGFRCFDFIRPLIWSNEEIEICYRQNILVFSKDLTFPSQITEPEAADVIHPAMWRLRRHKLNQIALQLNALAIAAFDKTLR